jgi:hypothetical protein
MANSLNGSLSALKARPANTPKTILGRTFLAHMAQPFVANTDRNQNGLTIDSIHFGKQFPKLKYPKANTLFVYSRFSCFFFVLCFVWVFLFLRPHSPSFRGAVTNAARCRGSSQMRPSFKPFGPLYLFPS